MTSRVRPERRGYAKINYEQHRDRVKTITSTVDCGPPHPHPFSNKREQDKRREFAAIEFDNKLMLERLAKVVQHKSIDNEIHHSVAMHQNFKKKLVLTQKRIQMLKLTKENQYLLKRIQEVPPAYSAHQWAEEAKHREVLKRCMALYPEYYEKEDAEKERLAREKSMMGHSVSSMSGGGSAEQSLTLPPISKKKNSKTH